MTTPGGEQVLQSANGVAEGFAKFGPYIWGLSLALVALAVVSILLLRAKNREIERGEKRVDALELQVMTLQEKRIADRDTFQQRLDALARETNETSNRVVAAIGELARQVTEHSPRKKPGPPATKEGAG